jgi:hypothetical protein
VQTIEDEGSSKIPENEGGGSYKTQIFQRQFNGWLFAQLVCSQS